MDNLNDLIESGECPKDDLKFVIDDDSKAEWALGKIQAAEQERDRLLKLVNEKWEQLVAQQEKIENDYERDTSYLKYLLQQYMGTVTTKKTKTQETYQLLSGKLIRKHGTPDFKRDDGKLLQWLKDNGRVGLIKTKEEPAWAELKKHLVADPDSGMAMIDETGEVVDGITVTPGVDKFDIKFG